MGSNYTSSECGELYFHGALDEGFGHCNELWMAHDGLGTVEKAKALTNDMPKARNTTADR